MDFFNLKKLKLEKENLESEIQILKKVKEKIQSNLSNLGDEISNLNNDKNKLEEQIKKRQEFWIEKELIYINSMNGLEFEIYIANIFAILGYNIQLTKATR
jgi:predicted  nucleic acid-binding Zn-ribbon protein